MLCSSQYCAYRHFSSMLERSGSDWLLFMFEIEIYFDDSGTDKNSPIAVAACYIANKEQWDLFSKEWDAVRRDEGFDAFHMAEFVAKPEHGHRPFCDWDNRKKERVYARLASIINTRTRRGIALAVPKREFDKYVIPELLQFYASDHYTWAVKSMMGLIAQWREQYKVTGPIQYVFDRGSLAQPEVRAIWDESQRDADSEPKYGIVANGVAFQDMRFFSPLQAADILAWQTQNHMRKVIMKGLDGNKHIHPGFRVLRNRRPVTVGFFSEQNLQENFAAMQNLKQTTGKWPWEPPETMSLRHS